MKIQIYRQDDNNIFTGTDYRDIKDRGEISHIICQLEIIKKELLEIWDEYES